MSTTTTSSNSFMLASQPWRPWSIPLNISHMCRTLRGLLNKIAKANFESISDKIVQLAISVEKTENPQVLDTFVRTIFKSGIVDGIRVDVYATLCQKIVDELEGERGRWKRVDLFHLGNPMDCFETSFRLLSQYEFDRIITGESLDNLLAFMAFVGELLVEGVVFPDDVHGMLDTLFRHAVHDDGYAVAIYRFLARVVGAFNASQVLEPLMIVLRIEALLEENITVKARYLMMSMLDQALYPRPHDAFGSVQQRIEVYGLDPDDSDFESAAEEEEIQHADDIYSTCQTNSRQYILNRQSSAVEKFVQALEPEHRHILISYLVSTTLESGGASDATFVATLFSLEGIRCLCDRNVFIEGFTSEVALLDDTSIDIPQAYQLMAIMLIGSPLNLDAVEELTSNLRSLDIKDRLMDTYTTLDPNSEVDTSNRTSSQEALFGREYNDVERSRPSSGRMYAH